MFDKGSVADGIAVLVKGNVSGRAVEADGGQGGHYVGGISGTGGLQGLKGSIVGVVAQDGAGRNGGVAAVIGQRGGIVLHVLGEARVKFRVAAHRIEGGAVDIQVRPLAYAGHHVGVQGIAAQNGHSQTLGVGLLQEQRKGLHGDRRQADVAALVLGGGDVGGKVGVALLEALHHAGAAQTLKGFLEVVAHAH